MKAGNYTESVKKERVICRSDRLRRASWRHFGQYGTSLPAWRRLWKLIIDLGLPGRFGRIRTGGLGTRTVG